MNSLRSFRTRPIDDVLHRWLGFSQPPVKSYLAGILAAGTRWSCCPRCGQGVGQGELTGSGCGGCRHRPGVLNGVIRLGAFHGSLAEAVRSLKYGGRWELAGPLGRLLARRVRAGLHARGMPRPEEGGWLVVPMPMPRWRRRYRGLDHARLLADAVAGRLSLDVIQPLRKREGTPQAALSRTGRSRATVSDYRLLRSGIRGFGGSLPNLEGAGLIVVDDVLTTGRSLRAAGTVLERLGPARMVAAVLAVTEQRDSPVEAPVAGGPLHRLTRTPC